MTKFIQCEQCRVRIEDEVCKFATYVRVIDGKKHVFCCEKCAERYQKEKTQAA